MTSFMWMMYLAPFSCSQQNLGSKRWNLCTMFALKISMLLVNRIHNVLKDVAPTIPRPTPNHEAARKGTSMVRWFKQAVDSRHSMARSSNLKQSV